MRRGFARPREPAACFDAPSPAVGAPDAGGLLVEDGDARFVVLAPAAVSWRFAVLLSDVFPAVFVDAV